MPGLQTASDSNHSGLPPCDSVEELAGWILDTARLIGRRSGFSHPDARDFAGWVAVRLIRRDYAVVRACRDPQRLRSYLRRVMRNLAKDYRNHLWGKWRPSTAAERLGPYGVELERLCMRDEFTIEEAIEILRCRRPQGPNAQELEEMAGRLPLRPKRAQVELDARKLGRQAAVEPDADDIASQQIRVRIRSDLAQALAALDAPDRELLAKLFDDGRSVASVARELDVDLRALYSRRDRCFRRLRHLLRERGLGWPDVAVAFGEAY